uniref:Olfactory receptor n=1 Tax=Podarcis muralis TaxID=64176 RepID=A0A670J808_PODMU
MENGTHTVVVEFVLQGISEVWLVQLFFCTLLLLFYAIILPGNVLIIMTIRHDPHLGSPMFFFLANLAFMDICYSCVTTPKIIANFLAGCRTISYRDCMAQLFFIHFLGGAEIILLISMAVDRYVAICHPMHYVTVVTRVVCWAMLVCAWAAGFIHSMIQVILIAPLPFCGPNELDNFFCDTTQIIKLACTNTNTLEFVMFVNSGLVTTGCFIFLLISYVALLVKVRKGSSQGKNKAASTCTSHLIVVTMYFGPIMFIYLRPYARFMIDKVLSVFYMSVTPLLNPTIYALKNKEMKAALGNLLARLSGQVSTH